MIKETLETLIAKKIEIEGNIVRLRAERDEVAKEIKFYNNELKLSKYKNISYARAIQRAKYWAAKIVRERGIIFHRWKTIHGVETEAGPEWAVEDIRDNKKTASLWYPSGENREKEAIEMCHFVTRIGTRLFGLTIRGIL